MRACFEVASRRDGNSKGWIVVRSMLAADGEPDEVCVASDPILAEMGVRECALRAMTVRGFFPATTGKPRTVTGWYGFQRAPSGGAAAARR